MPKIYEYFGLVFLFFSEDHEPIHVHVRHGELESKFEFVYKDGKLIDVKKKRSKNPLNEKQTKDALTFIKKYHKQIADKWFKFYFLKQKVKNEKITTKIK